VEDEYIVALDLARSFEQIGASVMGPVGSVARALALLSEGTTFDMAVDINLGSEQVFPVADALWSRGLPFVFATGYDTASIPSACRGCRASRSQWTSMRSPASWRTWPETSRRSASPVPNQARFTRALITCWSTTAKGIDTPQQSLGRICGRNPPHGS
jgi:hypothetical protein